MTRYKRQRIAKYVLKKQREQEHLCNFCGETCLPDVPANETPGLYGLASCYQGGYHSEVLDDLTNYEFNICEYCLDHLFSLFKIPPKTTPYGGVVSEDYKPFLLRSIKSNKSKVEYLHRSSLRTK